MAIKSFLIAALATLAIANPIPEPEAHALVARQGLNSNDIEEGICRPVTLIFARGSTEQGNMGLIIGGPTCAALKAKLGAENVACQGVGGDYTANLLPNFLSENTDAKSIAEATKMFTMAKEKCPDTQIVAGGYSQGSAVIDNSVKALDEDLKAQVKGVTLFGFTRNVKDKGTIPNYPKEQVKVFCALGDMVCVGTLIITPAHLTYGINAREAAEFLAGTVSI
ncbi:putative cutinase [Aspergillus taichungensis]|uniref:Cutinase n=1 Tax=Aspergillus taichungensis TaxID=482145 RepID=A0A2J5HR16_9EURO|nr:putative cutinase [Aspergillus taichungensis]